MLEFKNYNEIGNLKDETSALENFYDYSGSTYICDAIMEIADSNVPIYTSEIWKYVADIQEYVEEAIAQGLCDTGRNVDLTRIFQAGYYEFYASSLYQNLDELTYNYMVKIVNEYLNTLTEEEIEKLDLDEIESNLDIESENYDNNNTFSDLENFANTLVEEIKDQINEE